MNVAPILSTQLPASPDAKPREGGGVQGFLGDIIRASAAGYDAAARATAVEADKAGIHPFEAVTTLTGKLKQKTANVKGVSKATGLLHTVGGFGMLLLTANVSSSLRAPGGTAVDLAGRLADAIDGRSTAKGWNLGWGVRTPASGERAATEREPATSSVLGAALAQAGMQ